jgi:hypothetical protein
MIITAGRQGEQLCWSELWTGFSARTMRRPRHEDLTQFAVELESDASRVGELLDGLADWHLYAPALRGTFGSTARQVSRSAARRLLGAVTQAMDDVTFTIHPEYQLTVAGGTHDLTAEHRTFAARLADRQTLMIPSEDPGYGDLGHAFPPWPAPGNDAILQLPKPEIRPAQHILQRTADRDADREAAD